MSEVNSIELKNQMVHTSTNLYGNILSNAKSTWQIALTKKKREEMHQLHTWEMTVMASLLYTTYPTGSVLCSVLVDSTDIVIGAAKTVMQKKKKLKKKP